MKTNFNNLAKIINSIHYMGLNRNLDFMFSSTKILNKYFTNHKSQSFTEHYVPAVKNLKEALDNISEYEYDIYYDNNATNFALHIPSLHCVNDDDSSYNMKLKDMFIVLKLVWNNGNIVFYQPSIFRTSRTFIEDGANHIYPHCSGDDLFHCTELCLGSGDLATVHGDINVDEDFNVGSFEVFINLLILSLGTENQGDTYSVNLRTLEKKRKAFFISQNNIINLNTQSISSMLDTGNLQNVRYLLYNFPIDKLQFEIMNGNICISLDIFKEDLTDYFLELIKSNWEYIDHIQKNGLDSAYDFFDDEIFAFSFHSLVTKYMGYKLHGRVIQISPHLFENANENKKTNFASVDKYKRLIFKGRDIYSKIINEDLRDYQSFGEERELNTFSPENLSIPHGTLLVFKRYIELVLNYKILTNEQTFSNCTQQIVESV